MSLLDLSKKVFYYTRMLCGKSYDYIINNSNKKTLRMEESHNNIVKQLYNLASNPTNIIDNIYLGNAFNACDYSNLNKNNIKLIVNCTEEIPNYYPENFNYIKISIRDYNDVSILDKIEDTIMKINSYLLNNQMNSVLIHCYMGSSRSATILLAYLMKYYKMSLENALSYVKEKRNLVNLNISFYKELKEYENLLRNDSKLSDLA
jgi:protein-tyrosine phosphatase